MNKSSTSKKPMTLIFRAILNAPKLYKMQKNLGYNVYKSVIHGIKIDKSKPRIL